MKQSRGPWSYSLGSEDKTRIGTKEGALIGHILNGNEADAMIICAAPEMLSALKLASLELEAFGCDQEICIIVDKAIKKAEGRK